LPDVLAFLPVVVLSKCHVIQIRLVFFSGGFSEFSFGKH